MQRFRLYKYTPPDNSCIMTAAAHSDTMAWALIRNECVRQKKPVPTMDQVTFVRKLSAEETKKLMDQGKQKPE